MGTELQHFRHEQRTQRVVKVLNGLYNAAPYLPITRGVGDRPLAGMWDVILCPLADRPPVFAVAFPHNGKPPRGDLLQAFKSARSWLSQVFPEDVATGTSAAHAWVFGYVRPSSSWPGSLVKQNPPSVLCGWHYNWSRRIFFSGEADQWEGGRCKRVHIPTGTWSNKPNRLITGYRATDHPWKFKEKRRARLQRARELAPLRGERRPEDPDNAPEDP